MKKKTIWVTLALTIITGRNVLAQDTLVDHLIDACESDIASYCSQVTPGNGRLLHCMAAHEDKISGQCEYALYQAATLLEQLSMAISYVAQECESEIETLCNDVAVGEGRILVCLEDHEQDVGESCKAAIANTVGE
jgi:hypothetical protein